MAGKYYVSAFVDANNNGFCGYELDGAEFELYDAATGGNRIYVTESDEGYIMSMRHKSFDIRGIQYHPESVLTPDGKQIIQNWLKH